MLQDITLHCSLLLISSRLLFQNNVRLIQCQLVLHSGERVRPKHFQGLNMFLLKLN